MMHGQKNIKLWSCVAVQYYSGC